MEFRRFPRTFGAAPREAPFIHDPVAGEQSGAGEEPAEG